MGFVIKEFCRYVCFVLRGISCYVVLGPSSVSLPVFVYFVTLNTIMKVLGHFGDMFKHGHFKICIIIMFNSTFVDIFMCLWEHHLREKKKKNLTIFLYVNTIGGF